MINTVRKELVVLFLAEGTDVRFRYLVFTCLSELPHALAAGRRA